MRKIKTTNCKLLLAIDRCTLRKECNLNCRDCIYSDGYCELIRNKYGVQRISDLLNTKPEEDKEND